MYNRIENPLFEGTNELLVSIDHFIQQQQRSSKKLQSRKDYITRLAPYEQTYRDMFTRVFWASLYGILFVYSNSDTKISERKVQDSIIINHSDILFSYKPETNTFSISPLICGVQNSDGIFGLSVPYVSDIRAVLNDPWTDLKSEIVIGTKEINPIHFAFLSGVFGGLQKIYPQQNSNYERVISINDLHIYNLSSALDINHHPLRELNEIMAGTLCDNLYLFTSRHPDMINYLSNRYRLTHHHNE